MNMRSDFAIILKQFIKLSNGNWEEAAIDSSELKSECHNLIKGDLIETLEAMIVADLLSINTRPDWEGEGSYYSLKKNGIAALKTIYKITEEETTQVSLPELEDRVWQLFNLIRGQVPSEDFHFIFFLLFLQRHDSLKKTLLLSPSEVKYNISSASENLLSNTQEFKAISDFYIPLINKVDSKILFNLVQLLASLEEKFLKENFTSLFENLLYKYVKFQGRMTGELILPVELSRFVSSLATVTSNAKVYNPFAGFASFSFFLKPSPYYLGQEVDSATWALGALRILSHPEARKSIFLLGNSISNWNPMSFSQVSEIEEIFYSNSKSQKFDLIISYPPFIMKMPKKTEGRFGNINSYEHFLIEKGIESLNTNGKLIAVLSQSFLNREGNEEKLRRYLIQEDLLEMIISFPSGLLMNSGVASVAFVIAKNKKDKGTVRFVDAKHFVESSSTKEKKLNGDNLSAAISMSTDSDVIRAVSNETIANYDFNLNVPRYFQKEFQGVKLGNVGTIIYGRSISQDEKGKYVRIRDLKNNKLNYSLSTDIIKIELLPSNAKCIDESCLLVAIHWKNLKPTYFKYDGIPIYITRDIVAFKIDENKVDVSYLINELHADYVSEQVASFSVGDVVAKLKREDLLNIKIPSLKIEEQKAKVSGILELSAEFNQLKEERNALAHGLGQKQFSEFASLKHTLGTPRQNILSYAEALIGFFMKNSSPEFDKVTSLFKAQMGVELNSTFQAIKHDINFISELLEKGENGLILENYELTVEPLPVVLKSIQQLCSTHNYNFLSLPPSQIHDRGKEESESLGIRINYSLLKILFDNIFSNAHKYGFEKKDFSSAHSVIVELGLTDEGFFINILNNGKPFPKNIDKEKFISKYKTSDKANGTGLGGYDINRIAEYFETEWFLRLNTDPLFPVQFNFWFKPLLIK